MKKWTLGIALSLPMLTAQASFKHQDNMMSGYEKIAEHCKNMSCVQQNVQMIDSQIATLIAKRLAYVKRGHYLKSRNVRLQNQPGIGNDTMNAVGGQADYQGYPPGVAKEVFGKIIEQSNKYEESLNKKP